MSFHFLVLNIPTALFTHLGHIPGEARFFPHPRHSNCIINNITNLIYKEFVI